MLTDEKISADKDGPQEYYLVETQVFGGNSGSAAMFYFDERRNPRDTKLLLAGVVKGYFFNRTFHAQPLLNAIVRLELGRNRR